MFNKTGIECGDYFTVVESYNNNDRPRIGDIFKALSIDGTLIQAQRKDSLLDLRFVDTNRVKIVKVSD